MHRLLPELGADLFQGFMNEVQGALSKLQAQSSAVEDYVDKIKFLAKVCFLPLWPSNKQMGQEGVNLMFKWHVIS